MAQGLFHKSPAPFVSKITVARLTNKSRAANLLECLSQCFAESVWKATRLVVESSLLQRQVQ